jgi:RNA polymerase sigma-70 factor (ECF subfamily)
MTEPVTAVHSVAEFEALVRAHDRTVRSMAYRLVGHDVDDVLQQAYLKAYRDLPRFRADSSFGTWLHRIVYTTSLDHLRSGRRRESVARKLRPTAESRDPMQSVVDHIALDRALATLPVDQRAALLLVDGQGMGYQEAADVVGVAPGTIASRLSRARAAMRTELSRGGQS